MRLLTFAGLPFCVAMRAMQMASLAAPSPPDSAVHFPTAPTVIFLRGVENTPALLRGEPWVRVALLHVVLIVVAFGIVLFFRRGEKEAGLPRVDAKFAEEAPSPQGFVNATTPKTDWDVPAPRRLLDPDAHIREVAKKLADEAAARDLARSQRRNPLSRAHPAMFYIGDSGSEASTPRESSTPVWDRSTVSTPRGIPGQGRPFPTLHSVA
jgi:hypothetical protein